MKKAYLGVDTSNYTTSIALCDDQGQVIVNKKQLLPVEDGKCGLRQSDALFHHVKNLPGMLKELQREFSEYTIVAVGASEKPRQAEESYMPCFLSGIMCATSIATSLSVPLYKFAHQDGHIMAAVYSSGHMQLLESPFYAFHVSGGTTEVVLVTPNDNYYSVQLKGYSEDLHAGQAIDRAGVMMGFHFPCGREMEACANTYCGKVPSPKTSVKNGISHLSGLQNLSEKLYEETQDKALVSKYVFQFIGKTLSEMTEQIVTDNTPILYAGGVMSNAYIQSMLNKRPNTWFASPEFSSDNAAGISLLTRKAELKL